MAKTDDDTKALSLLVVFLRFYAGLKQTKLGKITGLGQALISRYESGKQELPEDSLRRIAAAAGLPWPIVRDLGRCFSATLRRTARRWEGEGLDEGLLDAALETALMAAFPYLIEELTAEPARPSPEAERQEAEAIWTNLQAFPLSRRRRLLELAHGAYPAGALAERIREASLQAADSEPDVALELANLALFIAAQSIAGPTENGKEDRR
jgi:transcriptional regulator with XRE-family HTH domain